MNPAFGLLIALATLLAMEGVAYVTHRWVMHGFLWSLHRSHHEPRTGTFEQNDWFAVIFATPSILCFYLGVELGLSPVFTWVGIGIAGYGLVYFIFHDIIVHRRIANHYVPRSAYMKRITQAHRIHHAVETKHGAVSFGFIFAPPVRVLKAQLAANEAARLRAPTPAGA